MASSSSVEIETIKRGLEQVNDFKKITVIHAEDKSIIVNNPTNYPLIGKGVQGAVFQLSDRECVKIFPNPSHAMKEKEALLTAHHLPFVPKMFEFGSNYIVMEFCKGPSLKEYIQKNRKITESITKELVFILKEMKRIGFTSVDLSLRHVIMTENGFKLVDHVHSFSGKAAPKPLKLFSDLSRWGVLVNFLQQVKEIDPKLYQEWGEK